MVYTLRRTSSLQIIFVAMFEPHKNQVTDLVFVWLGMRDGARLKPRFSVRLQNKMNFVRFLLLRSLRRTPRSLLLTLRGFSVTLSQTTQKARSYDLAFCVAGDEGFEPPITGPEPVALPLGQSPTYNFCLLRLNFKMFWF